MAMANECVHTFKSIFLTRARLRRRVLGAEYFCRVLYLRQTKGLPKLGLKC